MDRYRVAGIAETAAKIRRVSKLTGAELVSQFDDRRWQVILMWSEK